MKRQKKRRMQSYNRLCVSVCVCVCVCVTGDGLIPLGESDLVALIRQSEVKFKCFEAREYNPICLRLTSRPPFKATEHHNTSPAGHWSPSAKSTEPLLSRSKVERTWEHAKTWEKRKELLCGGKRKRERNPCSSLFFSSDFASRACEKITKKKENSLFSTGRFVYDVRGFCFGSLFLLPVSSAGTDSVSFSRSCPIRWNSRRASGSCQTRHTYTQTDSWQTAAKGQAQWETAVTPFSLFSSICVSSASVVAAAASSRPKECVTWVLRSWVVVYRQKMIRKRPVQCTCRCLEGICHSGAYQARDNRTSSYDPRSPDERVRIGPDTGRLADLDTQDCNNINRLLAIVFFFKL